MVFNPVEELVTALNEGRNIFLTGAGGTGKSFLLKGLMNKYPNQFVVTSSTGISASLLMDGAMTIHSFSGIGVRAMPESTYNNKKEWDDYSLNSYLFLNDKQRERIRGCKRLIIDEVSMISKGQLDLIDQVFRHVKGEDYDSVISIAKAFGSKEDFDSSKNPSLIPFGGIQVIITGDFCFGRGTEIMMFDGNIKKIEDIAINDMVMGYDFKPRKVLRLFRGKSKLFKIIQANAMNYIVTENHKLVLKRRGNDTGYKEMGDIVKIPTNEYIKKSNKFKEVFGGFKVECIPFKEREVFIKPYYLGLWLGDGDKDATRLTNPEPEIMQYCNEYASSLSLLCNIKPDYRGKKASRITITNGRRIGGKNTLHEKLRFYNIYNNKHIPEDFLLNSEENRLELLAGLLDTDGCLSGNRYSISQVRYELLLQIKQLADQLGFRTGLNLHKKTNVWGLTIGGDIWRIPCKVKRKIAQEHNLGRNRLNSSISVEELGIGDFFGIEIDGDNLFLLRDGTVVHNCQLPPVKKINIRVIENNPVYFGCAGYLNDIVYSRQSKTNFQKIGEGLKDWKELSKEEFEKLNEPEYAFESRVWKEANLKTIYLKEIKRTENKDFAEFLHRLRVGNWNEKDFFYLQKLKKNTHTFPPVKLFARNSSVDKYNNEQLALVDKPLITLKAKWRGKLDDLRELKKGILAPDTLELKEGCRVMILVNKPEEDSLNDDVDYVNGSTGVFVGVSEMETVRKVWIKEKDPFTGEIRKYKDNRTYAVVNILLDNGKTVSLKRKSWNDGIETWDKELEAMVYETEFSQYPIKLAYALTSHKSQGASIDFLEIDTEKFNSPNQFYVALSRATDPNKIRVLNLKTYHIKTCPKALGFYKELEAKGDDV